MLTPNTTERATLSSYKFIGAFGGGMIITACLMNSTKVGGWLNASTPAQGWFWAFVIIGVISTLSFLIVFFNTKERVLPPKAQQTSVLKDLSDLSTNWPWWVLLATTLTWIFFCSLRGSVETYYFKYYVGPQGNSSAIRTVGKASYQCSRPATRPCRWSAHFSFHLLSSASAASRCLRPALYRRHRRDLPRSPCYPPPRSG